MVREDSQDRKLESFVTGIAMLVALAGGCLLFVAGAWGLVDGRELAGAALLAAGVLVLIGGWWWARRSPWPE
jgi:hypothetical protein